MQVLKSSLEEKLGADTSKAKKQKKTPSPQKSGSSKAKESQKHAISRENSQVAINEDASKNDLYQLAAKHEIPGRSRMSKAELMPPCNSINSPPHYRLHGGD